MTLKNFAEMTNDYLCVVRDNENGESKTWNGYKSEIPESMAEREVDSFSAWYENCTSVWIK